MSHVVSWSVSCLMYDDRSGDHLTHVNFIDIPSDASPMLFQPGFSSSLSLSATIGPVWVIGLKKRWWSVLLSTPMTDKESIIEAFYAFTQQAQEVV